MTGLLAIALLAAPPSYEEAHAVMAMRQHGLVPHREPEGKRIAFVKVVRYEVFLEEEPFPTFPNWFHWLSEEDTIRRELLLGVGDTYDAEKVQETARNLRSLIVFSIVRVEPVQTGNPDEVGLLVVTRDLWSLRLETAFQVVDGRVNSLLVQLTERNLFGRQKQAAARYTLGPTTWAPGLVYADRRVAGEPVSMALTGDLVFRRTDSRYDGVSLQGRVERPFYDLDQRDGWRVPAFYQSLKVRRTQAGEQLVDADTGVPLAWDHKAVAVDAVWRRQYGRGLVLRLSGGLGISRVDVEPNGETHLERFEPDVQARFLEETLPPSRTDTGPILGAAVFQRRYRAFRDLASFGVSEDVQLGPSVGTTFRLPLTLLGSTRDALRASGSAGWTEDWGGDGLAELAVGGELRAEGGEAADQRYLARLRLATPSILLGRVVTRLDWVRQADDSGNHILSLGGDNGLRGYATQAFIEDGDGERLRGNVEWRTAPLVISYLHAGAVLFYDYGVLGPDLPAGSFHHSAGLGLRALLPQLNRAVFRVDAGVPLEGGFAILVGFESGQAVSLTAGEDVRQYSDSEIGGLYNQP